ncbi:hypothetical protein ACX12L_22755 [Alicycliphilus sp. T452]
MNDFKKRQITQMRLVISDFREGKVSLGGLLSKLEGAARAFDQNFWEHEVFAIVLELEQINVDIVEERRGLTDSERLKVEELIFGLEKKLIKPGPY